MIRRPAALPLVLLVLVIAGTACRPPAAHPEPAPTPLPLARCDDNSGIICLVTFGVEPPNEMLVAIHVALGGFKEIRTEIVYDGSRADYPCRSSAEFPGNFHCTGPQVPLGSRIRVEVFTAGTRIILAAGEFTLTAFAMPTVPVGTLPPPGTAYPNP